MLDFFRIRKRDYQLTFNSLSGQAVYKDLVPFCHADTTCVILDKDGRVDERLTFMMEGRREVILRIQHHMRLSPQDLMTLHTGGTIKTIGDAENDD